MLVTFLCTKLFGEQQQQNEQSTNSEINIGTWFIHFVRRVRRNLRYTSTFAPRYLVWRFLAVARVVVHRGRGRANFGSQCKSYRHPTVTHSGSYRHPFARRFFCKITIGKAFVRFSGDSRVLDFAVQQNTRLTVTRKTEVMTSVSKGTIILR